MKFALFPMKKALEKRCLLEKTMVDNYSLTVSRAKRGEFLFSKLRGEVDPQSYPL